MGKKTVLLGLIPIAIALLAFWAATSISRQRADVNYENAIEACERGNPRGVVLFGNTSNAIEQSIAIGDPPLTTFKFLVNKAILLGIDGADPKTGAVVCSDVVARP